MLTTENTQKQLDKTIVIDTETTGINPNRDEILQLSIIDGHGNKVFNEFFKPKMITEWKRAEQVNGISPETVADKPSIDSMREAIEKIITSADVIVGYNTGFDLGMIRSNLKITPRTDTQIVDVMEDFAEIYGEWDRFRHKWRWQKLTTCADYYGYDWGKEQAHDSLADCRATLFCYKVMYKYKVKEENL